MVRDDDRERDDDPESGQVGRRGAALLHDKPVYDRRQYAANGRLNRQELFSNDQGLIYNGTGRVKVRGDASLIKKEEMREVRVRAVDPVAGSERGGGFRHSVDEIQLEIPQQPVSDLRRVPRSPLPSGPRSTDWGRGSHSSPHLASAGPRR